MLKLFHSPKEFLQKQAVDAVVDRKLSNQVTDIIEQVRKHGDRAVRSFTHRFDRVVLSDLKISESAISEAVKTLDAQSRELFEAAIANVRHFHQKQRPESWLEEAADGSTLGMRFTPIETVGIYVPGGTAGYPSTVIMTVVPAQIAGVDRILLVSPPAGDGLVNPLVLAVAGLLDLKEVYAIGGAQAIAALAFGTETVPKVDKIVGPGNAYVNEAKRQVFGTVGIDQLAGPTEVVILADETANPQFVVRDLFAQAEHDTDARAILVTVSKDLAEAVQKQAQILLRKSERAEIVQRALEKFGAVVLVANLEQGADLVNELAPEHLQIMTANPETVSGKIRNAGAICLGGYTPVAVGDYFAGTNHVLPTRQNARFSSPLSVSDFMKFSSVMKYSEERLRRDAPRIAKFAELEGLTNHKKSVECRYE